MVFSEGIPGWKKAGYPLNTEKAYPRSEIPRLTPVQLQEKLGDVYLLDIRYERSYKRGFIKGSQNIPIYLLSRRVQEVPMGKTIIIVDSREIPTYISAGWFLKSKGHTDVLMLRGGIRAWMKEGLPVEK
jgi:hydroxyacylglutathione hydrolase